MALRIRDKLWQGIGNTIPNAWGGVETNKELLDEARD
jgi:hypothetical protein